MGAKGSTLNDQVKSNIVGKANDASHTRMEREKVDHEGKIVKRHEQEKKKKINLADKLPKEQNYEESVLKVLKKHNSQSNDFELINECLKKHFFMKKLDDDARGEIVKQMSLCEVSADTYVCKQGTMGYYFYIIKDGVFDVEINEKRLKTIKTGESFGELALIHGANRSASIKSTSKAYLYTMERKHFRKICDHIRILNFEENKKFIQSIPILSNMDNDLKSVLANNLLKVYYNSNDEIVKQGEDANCMYIIKEGTVQCLKDGRVVRTLNKGDHFGEVSILTGGKRTLNVVASSSCVIYDISVETLKSMVGENYKEVLYFSFIKMSFSMSSFFSKINSKILENAFPSFETKFFSYKETAIDAKTYKSNNTITVLIEGNLVDKITSQVICKRGEILMESSVSSNKEQKLKNDLVADPDCILVTISKDVFLKDYSGSFDLLFNKSNALGSIAQIPLFKNFSQQKLQTLCNLIKVQTYENGKSIIVQGQQGNKFYIVKSGMVDIFINNNYIRSVNENGWFGERALFFKEPRSATAQANGRVEVYYLEDVDFMNILEPSLKEYLYSRFYLQDATIELKDLDFIMEVGKGSFGAVSLVKNRKTKHTYALKCMSKNHIDYEGLHNNVNLEKSLLLKIDHPFIVKLVKTMKDNGKFIFFLMEFVKGKELFDVIRDIGFLNDDENKFFAGSLLLAIDYLHERNIVYRDLKPENIIVCENVSI